MSASSSQKSRPDAASKQRRASQGKHLRAVPKLPQNDRDAIVAQDTATVKLHVAGKLPEQHTLLDLRGELICFGDE